MCSMWVQAKSLSKMVVMISRCVDLYGADAPARTWSLSPGGRTLIEEFRPTRDRLKSLQEGPPHLMSV